MIAYMEADTHPLTLSLSLSQIHTHTHTYRKRERQTDTLTHLQIAIQLVPTSDLETTTLITVLSSVPSPFIA